MPLNPLPVAAGQCSDTGIRLADQDAVGCLFSFQYKSALLLVECTRMGDFDDHRGHVPIGKTDHAPVLDGLHPARPGNDSGALHFLKGMPLKPFRWVIPVAIRVTAICTAISQWLSAQIVHQNLETDSQPSLPVWLQILDDITVHGPFDEHQLVTSALGASELDDTFHCWHLVYIACISLFCDFSQHENLILISKTGMLYNHIAITER